MFNLCTLLALITATDTLPDLAHIFTMSRASFLLSRQAPWLQRLAAASSSLFPPS
jgi:hypothetical protein